MIRMFVKRTIERVRNSIWLYPVLCGTLSLCLALVLATVDSRGGVPLGGYALFYTTPELAQTVLSIVAGAFITTAIFTFSTTMVVLTMYSSQFTPRVVENFLDNRTTMKSFGLFLGGFVYAVTSLMFMDTGRQNVRVLAAGAGVLYSIAGLIYFLVFIHNVSMFIQVDNLILRLHRQALEEIGRYRAFVERCRAVPSSSAQERLRRTRALSVPGLADGFIQEIDRSRLEEIVEEHSLNVCIRKLVGQPVSRDTEILTLHSGQDEDLEDDLVERIRSCVRIGNKRTQSQDFGFAIQKIVEIALKALSPGINDPNTAVHCLKFIGLSLREVAGLREGYLVPEDMEGDECLFFRAHDLSGLLFGAYHQIVLYGKGDVTIAMEVLRSLRSIKTGASESGVRTVEEYAAYLFEKWTACQYDELEMDRLRETYRDLLS